MVLVALAVGIMLLYGFAMVTVTADLFPELITSDKPDKLRYKFHGSYGIRKGSSRFIRPAVKSIDHIDGEVIDTKTGLVVWKNGEYRDPDPAPMQPRADARLIQLMEDWNRYYMQGCYTGDCAHKAKYDHDFEILHTQDEDFDFNIAGPDVGSRKQFPCEVVEEKTQNNRFTELRPWLDDVKRMTEYKEL